MQVFKKSRSFRKEFKRQVRMAVMAAIGFSVAFAWRNFIWNSVNDFVSLVTESTHAVFTGFLTALLITLIAVVLIFITSRILRD